MPCLNEAETIARCIEKAQTVIKEQNLQAEIVIGDNGSTDGSQQIANDLGARVVDVPIRGYGAALYHACQAAQGAYIIMGDADDSYNFLELFVFLKKLREGADLVIGNRFKGGIRPGAMPWKNRYIGNPVLSWLGRTLFRIPVGDFHCGMRGFSKAAFKKMDLRTTGMEFASEMVVKAALLELKITEVPTTLSPDGRSRKPHLRPWRDGWRHLRFLLLFSPKWLFLYPGLLLTLFGIGLVSWLYPGPQKIASVEFDIHSMLFGAAFTLIGVQAVCLAGFTRIASVTLGLVPGGKKVDRILSRFSVEHGLGLGLLLTLCGLIGTLQALSDWAKLSFGNIFGSETLRTTIVSVLLLTLGLQFVLNAFYFGILEFRTRLLEPLAKDTE